MRITASDAAACTNGTLVGADVVAQGLTFDSRSIIPGQAFVAVVAARDGHDFLDDARTAGAAFAIVGRGRSVEGMTCVEVDDTESAVARIGVLCRDRLGSSAPGRIIAITGSAGKTSTKDMVLAVLRSHWPEAHGALLSFNNDLGVPVTLANAPDDCPAVVVEMGMRGFGEIERLCSIARPDVGVVTIVGDAHSDRVGGIDGVARAKSELPQALRADGTAVLNADDPRVMVMRVVTDARVVTFGSATGADVSFTTASVAADGCHTIDITHAGSSERVRVPLPGEHMARNACAAVAAGVSVGVPFAKAVQAIGSVTTAPGRMQWLTAPDGTRILDDSYNANSSSVEAALRTLAETQADRRIAVLGVMAEISAPEEAHARIAGLAASLGIELVAYGTDLYGVAPVDEEGALRAIGARGPGVAVVVKGSRAARTERVVAALNS